ncbi:MAG TPA: class I SAM-dependent methyltransferase [Terriglobales bacterium]|nr:class I SAM-dependent methyltransferase [Terriglobales bacterium]
MASIAEIRNHYDSLAFVYQTFWGDHLHHGLFVDDQESPRQAQIRMLDHCIQRLDLRGEKEVLDLGCGYGGTLIYLARLLDCHGVGLTISPKQARIAKESIAKAGLSHRLTVVLEDVATFLFPAEAFDLVWAMESSEHFANKPQFLRDVAYTLRPGGKLLLTAWTGSMQDSRVSAVARSFLCPDLWTAEQYRGAIEATGMVVQHGDDLTSQIVRTWEICRDHARRAEPVVKLLPRAARLFVDGIETILEAYQARALGYSVLVAKK